MRIEFITTDYQFSHGKLPRGLGSWAFSYLRNPTMDQIFWVHGTFSEAKKVARQKAQKENQPHVYVLP
jgi:hypothetical protein